MTIYKAIKSISFSWHEVIAINLSGAWRNLCPQFVHYFCGFKKVNEEFKEVFSSLVILREKLELYWQEDDFTELPAVQQEELTNERLMESRAQERTETRGRSD